MGLGLVVVLAGGAMGQTSPVRFEPVADEADRVVIVANVNNADSMELARFYSERRGIPGANIVALDLPAGEEIGWQEYVSRLQGPLQAWLIERGWLNAIEMDLHDEAGRRKISASGHRIAYLVTCRGVPLKIRQTDTIPSDALATTRDSFKTNRAAVDSEFSLLAQNETLRHGFVTNQIFKKSKPSMWDRDAVVRVSRLDGPTFPAARHLVDSAIEAEQRGLIGRAMVDIGGPHKLGDKWCEAAAKALTTAGWQPTVDRQRSVLGSTARADMVAIYLGWYAGSINGPFSLPGYEFAPGAIALHLHSFSTRTLRLASGGGGWTGPMVARGVAGTFGNVYEPYLEFTHQPQLLTEALLGGATLGEAAYYAMQVLSWQSLVVGDPLCRPMRVGLAEQWENRESLPKRLASYVALRHWNTVDGEVSEELIQQAAEEMRAAPSLAWRLAHWRMEARDPAGPRRELGLAAYLRSVRVDELGLRAEVAGQLSDWEDDATALKVWRVLLQQEMPLKVRLAWLQQAEPVA
ncbi:MAG: TIGR03790 family protein [Candidatus Synoicihabitans palmerolidicus]|nr:TIGR03790 family protein [Candidatus Synoicihabitans palmerolidicus]